MAAQNDPGRKSSLFAVVVERRKNPYQPGAQCTHLFFHESGRDQLHSVPQLSVLLETLPDRHWKMVKFWMKFFADHADTLQHGKLVPLHPELSYPLVTAYGKKETITAVYVNGLAVPVDPNRPHLIVNAQHGSEVILDCKTIPACVRTFDTLGNEVKTIRPDHAGLVRMEVPPSGYLEVLASMK